MGNRIDPQIHIGETHGIYYIDNVLPEKDKYGHWIYDCVCIECGFHKYSHYGAIAGEKSITTICNHKRSNGEYLVYGYKWSNKRIKNIFKGMIQRCYNPNDKDYFRYGGNGITIYEEWLANPLSFEKWSLNNGYKDTLTIDRIDSNKGYFPDNCQWITLEENSRKAGMVNWLTVNNETLTGRQWSEKFGLSNHTINDYIRKYGIKLTVDLIQKMIEDPPKTKCRKPKRTWFDIYGINTTQN